MKTLLICCLAPVVLVGTVAIACAPMFPRAIFTYSRHPDFPRTEYLNGNLGVFQPSYARSYLVIAYRYLKGPALSAMERQQVRDYWKDRETGDWDKTATDWIAKWEGARRQVPGAMPHRNSPATQGRYRFDLTANAFFPDCADDAYKTAYETMQARGARFGFASAAVRSWRDAQDIVFANCVASGAIPAAAQESLPGLIRQDREYQIAAAHFYSGHYSDAAARFRLIAGTADSPWRGIAPYLVVRALSRDAKDQRGRTVAEKEARDVLANPKLSALHGMTRVLLHRMILQDGDEKYFHELGRDLASGRQDRSFREELWDYTILFDRFAGYDVWESWNQYKGLREPSVFSGDDLSDWIATFQRTDSKAGGHALARWRQSHQLSWLIASLRHTEPQSPGVDDLIAAAAGIDPSSPGYEIASYYRLKLLVDSNRKLEARTELDSLVSAKLPKSSANLFRALRMRAAPDLAEFLTFSGRTPVLLTTDWNVGEVPNNNDDSWERHLVGSARWQVLLDRDSIKILNERTPIRLFAAAALGGQAPPYAERDFVMSAFTRALLLDDSENGDPLAAKLRQIGADPQGFLRAYENTSDPDERRFAGIFYVLHHPEARPYLSSGIGRMGRPGQIDDFRDNWWCPVDLAVDLDARTNWSQYAGPRPPRDSPDSPAWSAGFLTDNDRRDAAAEMTRLAATNSGPDYMIQQTLNYAQAHPRDPRIPEALHYALRSQHYGCVRKETAGNAKIAWRYLWRKYPNNSWTRKTNYNFETENLPRAAKQ